MRGEAHFIDQRQKCVQVHSFYVLTAERGGCTGHAYTGIPSLLKTTSGMLKMHVCYATIQL